MLAHIYVQRLGYVIMWIMTFPKVETVLRLFVGRAGTCAPAPTPQPRPQAVGEDDPGTHCAQREAAAHTAHMLQRQPATRRAHEGAAGGDDGPQSASYPRLVPEQTL